MQRYLVLFIMIFVVACGGTAEPTAPPVSSSPTEPPTTTDAVSPEAATVETAAESAALITTAGGRNDNGTFYRGSADAPLTFVEYSDFL